MSHFDDPLASQQRFVLQAVCEAGCRLELRSPNGGEVKLSFADLMKGPAFSVGDGTLYIDSADPISDLTYEPSRADLLARHIRSALLHLFGYAYAPLLVVGAAAFVATTLLYWKEAYLNVAYVLALVTWVLALSRAALLLLVASTSMPTLGVYYMAPAYFMLVCGAVFSVASLLQLSRSE